MALVLASGCDASPSGPVLAGPSPATTSGSAPASPDVSTGASATPGPTAGETGAMADLVVEIHVPLTAAPGRAQGDYPYPWIDDVEEYLAELDGSEGGVYDDGEELGEEYVFFVSDAPEAELIQLARRVSKLEGVPDGVYAVVTDAEGDPGQGRRVELR